MALLVIAFLLIRMALNATQQSLTNINTLRGKTGINNFTGLHTVFPEQADMPKSNGTVGNC